MSSAIYLTFGKPIELSEWEKFCSKTLIEYSPNTIGWSVYYWGGTGGVEILFGEGHISEKRGSPSKEVRKIIVKTFFMGDLDSVAKVAKLILKRWDGEPECDLELKRYFPVMGGKAE